MVYGNTAPRHLKRILFVVGALVVFRLIAHIPLPIV
jgi:preprotein translocase subunit SecY